MFSVLHVDNNRFYHAIVKNLLAGDEIKYIPVRSPREAYNILENTKVSLVITGLIFEDESGEQFLKSLNSSEFKGLPILVLTSSDDDNIKMKSMELGPFEYINKSTPLEKLKEHIHSYNKSESIEAEKAIDLGGWGVLNQRSVFEKLSEEVKRHRKSYEKLSVILFSIDRLKHITGIFGKEFGDEIINTIENIIKKQIGSKDIVGKYNKDDYLIILTSTDLNEGAAFANNLRNIIEETIFGREEVAVTISCGVAQLDGEEPAQLLDKVNEFMLKAKRNGSNRVEFENCL